jgi:hypothetical protein
MQPKRTMAMAARTITGCEPLGLSACDGELDGTTVAAAFKFIHLMIWNCSSASTRLYPNASAKP